VPPNVGGLRYLVDGIEKDRAAASSRTFLPRSLALILRVAADEPIYKRFPDLRPPEMEEVNE
jgi:hypothetical protein